MRGLIVLCVCRDCQGCWLLTRIAISSLLTAPMPNAPAKRPHRLENQKVGSLSCCRKNWYCWSILFRAYFPATKGLVARCISFPAPFHLMDEASAPGRAQRSRYVALISKGYRTMLATHDHFTHQMRNRLKITGMGLGLVRLLQNAGLTEEARTTLSSLENGFQGVAGKSDKPSDPIERRLKKVLVDSPKCEARIRAMPQPRTTSSRASVPVLPRVGGSMSVHQKDAPCQPPRITGAAKAPLNGLRSVVSVLTLYKPFGGD